MNILFVIPTLDTGGAQSFLLRLAIALRRSGHAITVLEMESSKRNESYYRALVDSSVVVVSSMQGKLYEQRKSWTASWLGRVANKFLLRPSMIDFLSMMQFQFLLSWKRTSVVNSHMYRADAFCLRHIGRRNIPWVSSLHGCYSLIQKDIQEKGAMGGFGEQFLTNTKLIFNRLNGIIYVTKHQLSLPLTNLEEVYLKCRKIYYGYLPIPSKEITQPEQLSNGLRIGMVARGDLSKGWESLIQAFLSSKKKFNKPVTLVLVGGGEVMNLKSKYEEPDIIFFGNKDNPMDYVRQFDIAVLPTHFAAESLPNSIIEYLYAGKPVIATAIAEIPEMIKTKDGQLAGRLIEINASTQRADTLLLATALIELVNDDRERLRCSNLAKEAFTKFSMDLCTTQYSSFFSKAIHPTA